MRRFLDRRDAGERLASQLSHLRGRDVVVVGLPPGGVRVAGEVARALGAPLDVVAVHELRSPDRSAPALGAVGEDGTRVVDWPMVARARVTGPALEEATQRAGEALARRCRRLRGERARLPLQGRLVVVVADGVANPLTARAACEVCRHAGARRVVLATPVAPSGTTAGQLAADELVCCATPARFDAVDRWYQDFPPVRDDEVANLLVAARA